jgi:hypothetical protein
LRFTGNLAVTPTTISKTTDTNPRRFFSGSHPSLDKSGNVDSVDFGVISFKKRKKKFEIID